MRGERKQHVEYAVSFTPEEAAWLIALTDNVGGDCGAGRPRAMLAELSGTLLSLGAGKCGKRVKWTWNHEKNYPYFDEAP